MFGLCVITQVTRKVTLLCYRKKKKKKGFICRDLFSVSEKKILTWDCPFTVSYVQCASLPFWMTLLKSLGVTHTGACWSSRKKSPKAIKTTSDYLLQPEWSSRMIRKFFSSVTTSEKLWITGLTCLCSTREQQTASCKQASLVQAAPNNKNYPLFHSPYILPYYL